MAHPVQELLCRVPPVCFGCILVCIIIQVIVFLMDVELIDFAIIPRSVIYMQEYYRLVSSAFFHSGLMHIGMNMLSAATFGFMLEKSIGSLALMFLILWSVVLSGFIYCFFAWVAFELTWDMEWLMKAAVGFSGVLFTLAVVESYTATAPTRSFFGVVNVPTRVYPWVLLIILQIMIPQISFLGHLSGLLVGVLYCYGCLGIFMPSTAFLSEMEKWRPFSALAAHPAFTPAPREILIESPSDPDCSSLNYDATRVAHL